MSRIKLSTHTIFVPREKERFAVTQCGIIFVREGSLRYKNKENQTLSISAGQFGFMHSYFFDHFESIEDQGRFVSQTIIIEPSLLREFLVQYQLNTTNAPISENIHPFDDSDTVAHLTLNTLLTSLEAEDEHSTTQEALVHALLAEMVALTPETVPLIKNACDQDTVQNVIRFIDLHLENDVTLDATAHFLGMSIATLKRRLAAVDVSFSQILKVKRINHAADKLRLSKSSIADIAFESGFKSAAHFSTAFKSVLGMTPKEFRQNILKK